MRNKQKKLEYNRAYNHSPRGREVINKNARRKRAEKRERLQKLKDKPCVDCGGKFPPVCMDFHHMGVKLFSIGQSLSHSSWQALLKETEKCILLCANCHRIRTHIQKS